MSLNQSAQQIRNAIQARSVRKFCCFFSSFFSILGVVGYFDFFVCFRRLLLRIKDYSDLCDRSVHLFSEVTKCSATDNLHNVYI